MSEIKYVTGKTVEAAMAAASSQYGNEKDVSYKIVEMPKSGFLGIGATPAKIEVTYENEDISSILKDVVSEIKGMKVSTAKGSDGNKAQIEDKKETIKPVENKKNEQNVKKEVKPAENKHKEEKCVKPEKQPKQEKSDGMKKADKNDDVIVTPEQMECAINFANTLLANMKINAKAEKESDNKIVIKGDNTNVLIGYHGETLDSIQYLINLCVCRNSSDDQREFIKITVDIENYRAKREETLRALARKMADKAIKNRRNVVLEPMNPYERRIIHSEIQDIENVSTHSVGSDENRKIVITYEGADKVEHKPHRRYNGNRKTKSNLVSDKTITDNE